MTFVSSVVLLWLLVLLAPNYFVFHAQGLGCNWGLHASHPLSPDIIVRLFKDNGFTKVKLFEADPRSLRALAQSGIEVMLGVPNEFLAPLARSVSFAEQWVQQNVSTYISKYGVDIRYVAVGNEPFLKTYKDMYLNTTFPALQNIQAALIKAGLGRQVKVTIPLNADVYQSSSGLPSGGVFRPDIQPLMLSIVQFLQDNAAPLTINIYPFLSLYADPNFPIEYAFFSDSAAPLIDGSIAYSNVFEANYDTLIWALEKNGFSSLPVIVGEIGWPTDGDPNANLQYAQKFNQGLINRIIQRKGTPKRPSSPPDVYIFALIDEDTKSIQPGNFERHWGMFYYDGTVKYDLMMDNGNHIVGANGVKYLGKQWCVLAPEANVLDPQIADAVSYACTYADCTSLGFGSTCNGLDVRSNVSYVFNQFYQFADQQRGACSFSNLSVITGTDPSRGTCRFEIMVDEGRHDETASTGEVNPNVSAGFRKCSAVAMVWLMVSVVMLLLIS